MFFQLVIIPYFRIPKRINMVTFTAKSVNLMTSHDVTRPLYPVIYSQNRLIDHASTFPKRMVIKVKRQTIARTRSYCEIRIGCENHIDVRYCVTFLLIRQ